MNLKLDISFFIQHCYYLNRVNIKNQKSKRFHCNNIVCKHTAIATKIGFDNQLPSHIARLNTKGETSIRRIKAISILIQKSDGPVSLGFTKSTVVKTKVVYFYLIWAQRVPKMPNKFGRETVYPGRFS